MSITKLIIILVNEEKYGEALELAIHNVERIKKRIKDLNDEIKDVPFYQNNNQEIKPLNFIQTNTPRPIINLKYKNLKDIPIDLNLNNHMLIRSYFLLGICYDKIGENISTFDDKLKSLIYSNQKALLNYF